MIGTYLPFSPHLRFPPTHSLPLLFLLSTSFMSSLGAYQEFLPLPISPHSSPPLPSPLLPSLSQFPLPSLPLSPLFHRFLLTSFKAPSHLRLPFQYPPSLPFVLCKVSFPFLFFPLLHSLLFHIFFLSFPLLSPWSLTPTYRNPHPSYILPFHPSPLSFPSYISHFPSLLTPFLSSSSLHTPLCP